MQTVLITGVGKGIGRALAEKFLSEGWFVMGTYLSSQLAFANDNIKLFKMDLASSASIADCAQEIRIFGRKIDIFINNAGVLFDEDDIVLIPSKLRRTLEVNVIGPADFTEQLLDIVGSGGHVINISSTAGSLELVGTHVSHSPAHYPSYKISKAALNMYARTLALRLKERDIVVSSVHPGWVQTNMGGADADVTPTEAAENIYNFALTRPETGQFWSNGEKLPW